MRPGTIAVWLSIVAAGSGLAAGAAGGADAGNGFDEALFRAFVTMRSGTGEHPVYWPCSGEVYSFPEGKLLFLMQGLDAGRLAPAAGGAAAAHGLHRSIMVYFDAATGKPIGSYGGKAVDPIGFATPFIHYTYALEGDRLSIVTPPSFRCRSS